MMTSKKKRARRFLKKPDDIDLIVDGTKSVLFLKADLINHLKAYPSDQHLYVNVRLAFWNICILL